MNATPVPNDIAALKRIIDVQEAVVADYKSVITDHEQLVAQLQEQVRPLKT